MTYFWHCGIPRTDFSRKPQNLSLFGEQMLSDLFTVYKMFCCWLVVSLSLFLRSRNKLAFVYETLDALMGVSIGSANQTGVWHKCQLVSEKFSQLFWPSLSVCGCVFAFIIMGNILFNDVIFWTTLSISHWQSKQSGVRSVANGIPLSSEREGLTVNLLKGKWNIWLLLVITWQTAPTQTKSIKDSLSENKYSQFSDFSSYS